ncbi:MAG: hypothetical protein DI556_04940 [Rhodovulum sulfidophilum]|uniref:Uncharacterized protein n=1 Tax=Rhodovulum sulfidophilum TaxID=35806 RepID=A0A2W5NKZ1_RHOSU|nr:MAG: hypothetical protein DI556_04940 [Rhodovulum sulfidophilum]
MAEYRSPKVTEPAQGGGSRTWLWAAAALVVLLAIAWLAGLFGTSEMTPAPTEPTGTSAPVTAPEPPAVTAPTPAEPPAVTNPTTPGAEPPAGETPAPEVPAAPATPGTAPANP